MKREKCVTMYKPPSVSNVKLQESFELICQTCLQEGKMLMVMGDLNVNMLLAKHALSDVADLMNMVNVIKGPTCFKSVNNPSLLDVILTNAKNRIIESLNIDIGVSDVHNMVCVATRASRPIDSKRVVTYRSYKTFNEYLDDLEKVPFYIANVFDDIDDCFWAHNMLLTEVINDNAPLLSRKLSGANTLLT